MNRMKCIKLLSVVVASLGLTFFVSAQTMEDVVNARNNGVNLMASGDLDEAIAEFEKCIELAEKVGEEAEFVQIEMESSLPGLYLQRVSKISRDDFEALLQALEATIAVAQKYNDARVLEDAERRIPQIYYALGNAAYQAQNYEEAIKNLDEAITRNPNLAGAYFLKGVCYETMRDEPNMSENYKLAIEKGRAFSDARSAQNAQQRLRNFHYNAGVPALRAPQRWDDAIAAFTKALEADENYFEAHYGLAMAYNGKRSWDNAIAHSEKALQIKEDVSVFWELGIAYKGKNDKTKACENFKKVTSGPRLENAKHEIDVVLKCN